MTPLSAFHAVDRVAVPSGLGDYACSMAPGVPENDQAALYLVRTVFNDLKVKLIVAGSDAESQSGAKWAGPRNMRSCATNRYGEIHRLVREAQVNVLPTFRPQVSS